MEHTEQLSIKISTVLQRACPAFKRIAGGAAEWHHCECKAVSGDPCTCVWHCTDTCIAGKWPQLSFVNDIPATKRKTAKIFLDKAQQAIAAAQIEPD